MSAPGRIARFTETAQAPGRGHGTAIPDAEAESPSPAANPWAVAAGAHDRRARRPHQGHRLGPLCGMAFALAVSAACWGGLAALVGRLW